MDCSAWLKEYKINLRPETKASYEMHIRIHLKPDLGKTHLNKLTTHQIQYLYNKLINERGLSPKTVKNVHGALHAALEQSKINGYLRVNPSEGTTLPKIEKEEIQTMDTDDVSAFLKAIESIGMSELRFHDLRHTFSVNSLQAGGDIKTIQENLGHATAAFTLATYAHATPRMKRESASRMDAFIRSVRENGETVSPVPVP